MSSSTSAEYEERGRRLLHSGRPEEALAVLEEGERRFPGDADLLLGTAMARLQLGELAEACQILEGLRLSRPTPETLRALAEAYLERGKLNQAVQAAVEAVNAAGRDAPLVNALGRAFYEHGRYKTALPFYDRAILIDDGWAEAWFGRGACLWALKQGDEAVKALKKAAALDPADWQARQFLGCALADLGRKDEARSVLESVPLDVPWQRAALERLVALAWWPSDPARQRAMEEAWRQASAR